MAGFFDRVKAGVGEKVIEASIRSKEALEAQQVKAKIGELQGQKRNALTDLGTEVYRMHGENSFDQEAIDTRCAAITAIETEIKAKEQELEEVHRRAEAQLAEQRGAEEKARAGASASPAACPECGTALEGTPKFCPSCGRKLQ